MLNGAIDSVRNAGQRIDLLGRKLPRPGFERHRIEIDPRHPIPQRRGVADFIERVGSLNGFDRLSQQRLVEQRRIGLLCFHDVALTRNANHRRRQVDEEAAKAAASRKARFTRTIVDNDDFAAVG